jgi:uncharacterized membrane protein
VANRSRSIPSWYRPAIVVAAIAVLAVVGYAVYHLFFSPRAENLAEARLLADGEEPSGVSGGLTTDVGASGLRLCNKTVSRVGVAIGYMDDREWTTEGWWNVAAGTCETLVPGPLLSRFYYLYAIDYDQGGVWGGKAAMCTRDKMFTIHGIEDCVARGFERNGFFEVDTGEQKSWTVQLTEPSPQGTGGAR